MTPENLIGDLVAIIASLVAFSYVLGMWRMVRAPSRLVLLAALAYMVATRVVILYAEEVPGNNWVEAHRSILIVPMYVLLATAFAMTYYELRGFRFDVPKDAEGRDTEAKHLQRMKDNSTPR